MKADLNSSGIFFLGSRCCIRGTEQIPRWCMSILICSDVLRQCVIPFETVPSGFFSTAWLGRRGRWARKGRHVCFSTSACLFRVLLTRFSSAFLCSDEVLLRQREEAGRSGRHLHNNSSHVYSQIRKRASSRRAYIVNFIQASRKTQFF